MPDWKSSSKIHQNRIYWKFSPKMRSAREFPLDSTLLMIILVTRSSEVASKGVWPIPVGKSWLLWMVSLNQNKNINISNYFEYSYEIRLQSQHDMDYLVLIQINHVKSFHTGFWWNSSGWILSTCTACAFFDISRMNYGQNGWITIYHNSGSVRWLIHCYFSRLEDRIPQKYWKRFALSLNALFLADQCCPYHQ